MKEQKIQMNKAFKENSLINKTFTSLLIGATLLAPLSAMAETAEEKGLAIAEEGDRRNLGWKDTTSDMTMVLRNKRGDESTRTLRVKTLEVADDGDKSMTIFDEPKDVRGTALLTYSHKVDSDDQWLYLPALKRVKRIASRNKSGPFMGSEFAFEDMSSQEIEKYDYKYLKDEACGTETCFVVERFPKDEYSGYTRQIAWIDQAEYRVQKVEYYDRKESLLKTLTVSNYQQFVDKYWRPTESLMVNHQTGKSTTLTWKNYMFQNGLSDSSFTKNSLKRAK